KNKNYQDNKIFIEKMTALKNGFLRAGDLDLQYNSDQ
ncbi:MAG: hypothetical protein ACJA0U_003215, partial [Salibacteraceae bacterium]